MSNTRTSRAPGAARHTTGFSGGSSSSDYCERSRTTPSQYLITMPCLRLSSVSKSRRLPGTLTPRSLGSAAATAATAAQAPNAYPNLLRPMELAHVTIRNRIIMGSMHTGLEEPGGLLSMVTGGGELSEMAAFYAERAKGGVGLIVTGGIAPNSAGRTFIGASKMSTKSESDHHKIVTKAVHDNGGHIAMQILHTGRYGYHFNAVSASAVKSPIGWSTPKALSLTDIKATVDDFVKCAELAKAAGYDGVEIMGSEGYLINQFLATHTNKRTDEYGGSYENRMRLPVEIVSRVRKAVGKDFIIIYRLSMLDLIQDGSAWSEVVTLAQSIEAAGATIINTGIGWHEARVPTIATMVPRGAFTWVTQKLKGSVGIPLCTTNRINSPDVAEGIIADGHADMVSMARPFLADPYFVQKAQEGRADEINTCIGCNQACLDHVFSNKRASCLVNPIAGYETSLKIKPVVPGKKQRIAVVGAGPAGLAFATTAAQRGHAVTLFEKDAAIGGQFNMAKLVPGKEEFFETLRYFGRQIQLTGVDLRLGVAVDEKMLSGYDSVVVATGVLPRAVNIPNKSTRVKLLSYIDVLRGRAEVGPRVAVIGAGGIGYDVADFLTHAPAETDHGAPLPRVDERAVEAFLQDWGIDKGVTRGGLAAGAEGGPAARKVYLLQRKPGKLGAGLGKTTGWIHRTTMKKRAVEELSGCRYVEINDAGLVVERGKEGAKRLQTLEVDAVVLCAGQESLNSLFHKLTAGAGSQQRVFLIGGAQAAGELDAKRAIDQGTRLAAVVEDSSTGQVFEQPVELSTTVIKTLQGLFSKK